MRRHAGEILLPRQERGKSAARTHGGPKSHASFLAYVKGRFSRVRRNRFRYSKMQVYPSPRKILPCGSGGLSTGADARLRRA